METVYQQQLRSLTAQLAQLCEMAGHAMGLATQAVLQADADLTERVTVRRRAIATMSVHVRKTALFLPMWPRWPVAADIYAVITAVDGADHVERMGALAVDVAQSTRRRHPQRAVPTGVVRYVAEIDALAVALAGHASAALLRKAVGTAPVYASAMQGLQRQLLSLVSDGGATTPAASAGLDVALVSRSYERFADHAVQIARPVRP